MVLYIGIEEKRKTIENANEFVQFIKENILKEEDVSEFIEFFIYQSYNKERLYRLNELKEKMENPVWVLMSIS